MLQTHNGMELLTKQITTILSIFNVNKLSSALEKEECLSQLADVLNSPVFVATLTNVHDVTNTLLFISASLHLASEPIMFQACWLKQIAAIPRMNTARFSFVGK